MKITVVWQNKTKITYKHYGETILDYENADKIGKEKEYGKTVLIGFSLPIRKRPRKAINDLVAGIRYSYPLCCIVQFCLDTLFDRPCAQLRYVASTDHVPCSVHVRKHGKQMIPLDLY